MANADWLVWTDHYCGTPPDRAGTWSPTKAMHRETGAVYDLGAAIWPDALTDDDRLGIGHGFGALSFFDLDSWTYDTVLSEGTIDVAWSPDFRYAARGQQPGHGGMCAS